MKLSSTGRATGADEAVAHSVITDPEDRRRSHVLLAQRFDLPVRGLCDRCQHGLGDVGVDFLIGARYADSAKNKPAFDHRIAALCGDIAFD